MHSCLAYGHQAGSLPCVSVDFSRSGTLSIKQMTEAVCIIVARNQPTNPLGLFRHPGDETETRLFCKVGADKDQDKVCDLIEFMYEACNNPLFVTVELEVTGACSERLTSLARQQHAPFGKGGLIDDERGDPDWSWRCIVTPETSASDLQKLAEVSNSGTLVFACHDGNDARLKAFRRAGIDWPVEILSE